MRAVGPDGEDYEWSRIYVNELRDGRLASVCQFDDDEEAAFAYADTLVAPVPSRLAVSNRASEVAHDIVQALRAHNINAAVGAYSDQLMYDDRRRLSGHPIEGRAGLRVATERILEQYSEFEARTLAVRGERLQLSWTRWSDDAGNETDYLHAFELGDDGRIVYAGRFDEDDFESAYRELDRRYYAGEGAAFTEAGAALTEFTAAINRGDFDKPWTSSLAPSCGSRIVPAQPSPIARPPNFAPAPRTYASWSPRCGSGLRPSAGCRPRGSSVATSASQSGATASGTHGRDFS